MRLENMYFIKKNTIYQTSLFNSIRDDNIIDYIKDKYGETKIVLHNKEILKTINTLSFVIDHMEKELKNKCMYLPELEWESCHFLKNK